MSKIDFYLIPETTKDGKFRFACRIAEKAYLQEHQIYIHTENEAATTLLDGLLWTFRDISFVPHNTAGEEINAPIQIGFNDKPTTVHNDILLNLDINVPAFFPEFKRIIEIVPNDKELQNQARKRYKFYKDQGIEVQTHDLKK
jgi:DNA polymerase III subunit chi